LKKNICLTHSCFYSNTVISGSIVYITHKVMCLALPESVTVKQVLGSDGKSSAVSVSKLVVNNTDSYLSFSNTVSVLLFNTTLAGILGFF